MANTASNARITEMGNTEVIVFAPNIQLMYDPNANTGQVSFSCSNYLSVANTFHQVMSQPNTLFVDMSNNMMACYGSQIANTVDPVTGADLTKISVAGVMILFQMAFDVEYNKKAINKILKGASNTNPAENGTSVSTSFSANGNVVSFSSNTTAGSNTMITNWGWLFGDGTYSLDTDPEHCYILPGTYTATFFAVDSSNTIVTSTQEITITT